MYDMFVGGEKEKEEEEPVEESLSEKLNKKENTSAEDVSSEDFVKLMNLLSAEEKDEQGDMPISSAVGWAEGCGADIRKIVNEADAKMYENKIRGKEGRK